MTTPAILFCPHCGVQHVDKGKWAKFDHPRHLCYSCGAFFDAERPTIGVARIG
jgi:transposase-like protein